MLLVGHDTRDTVADLRNDDGAPREKRLEVSQFPVMGDKGHEIESRSGWMEEQSRETELQPFRFDKFAVDGKNENFPWRKRKHKTPTDSDQDGGHLGAGTEA